MNYGSLASRMRGATGQRVRNVYVPKSVVREWVRELYGMGRAVLAGLLERRLERTPRVFICVKLYAPTLRHWADMISGSDQGWCNRNYPHALATCEKRREQHWNLKDDRVSGARYLEVIQQRDKLQQELIRTRETARIYRKALGAIANDLSAINGFVGSAQRIADNVLKDNG